MNTLHVFKIVPIQAGYKTPAKVKIHSQRYNEWVVISQKDGPFNTAVNYLLDRAYVINYKGEGILNKKQQKEMFIMSETFKPLK